MSTLTKDPMTLGIVLIVGALLYSKSRRAVAQPTAPRGTGSMPGSTGTGLAQVAGGLLGSFFSSLGSRGTGNNADGSPNAQTVADNIAFFKQYPVQDAPRVIDWVGAEQANPELLDNITQYGI